MIQDFSNPHNQITPIRVEDLDTPKKKYLIQRRQGFYYCYEKTSQAYELIYDLQLKKGACFPTLGEAENFIKRDALQEKNYYYEL